MDEKSRNRFVFSVSFNGGNCIPDICEIYDMSNKKANMNVPLDVTESNLDLSETLLCDFYYGYIIQKLSKNNVHLTYMDTDRW